MQYISKYTSPLGNILLAADDAGLTGLWFEGQKYFGLYLDDEHIERDLPVLTLAKQWLDIYFSGREPDMRVPLHLTGTAFRKEVWEILLTIPYGQTITYRDIAARIAAGRSSGQMSAQAAGGAVGRNPLSLIVPCHRVIGADGGLRGYAGGLRRKKALLDLEGAVYAAGA